MKRLIPVFLLATVFSGCLPEYRDGCPDELRLVFDLKDEYEPGNYDSRIAADIMLIVFNDKYFAASIPISYPEIADGKEYIIKKDDRLAGNVDIVAWAASTIEGYDQSKIPGQGDSIDDFGLGLEPITRSGEYSPVQCGLYMGLAEITEAIDEPSVHRIDMFHSSCRVEVNVIDAIGKLSPNGEKTGVAVYGSKTHMNLNLQGVGSDAVVRTSLDNDPRDITAYSTGRFGIMPSSEGQTLSVGIMNDNDTVVVLTLPTSAIPTGAKAGSLIIFDYVMGQAEFWVTVDGYRQKIVMVNV